ncbi:MAG: ABC transporter permease [Myxococcales bacterium]|nr:ABC transporter permease [Myxococcales bacterium]
MSAFEVIVSGTMLAQTVRMTIPYACASLGGVVSERSGVVNIALEGILLSSALAAVAVQGATGSASAGVLAGVGSGALVGLVHAALVVRGRIDAIVSGLAINLVAAGGTRFALRALYGSSSNSPSVRGVRYGDDWGLVLRTLLDPFLLLTLAAAVLLAWSLARTRFGLRLRACGEDPSAAQAVGVDVALTRTLAVTIGGAICGLGGTALAFELHQFQAGMTGGRGFIALAAVIVAGWRPWPALGACLAFATLDALQIVLQNQTRVPPQILALLPFVATLVALAVVSRRTTGNARAPAGLGKHPV